MHLIQAEINLQIGLVSVAEFPTLRARHSLQNVVEAGECLLSIFQTHLFASKREQRGKQFLQKKALHL